MTRGTFLGCCCQCTHPCGESLLTHVSTGDPPTVAGSFGSLSCGVTAPFLWVLVRFSLCPPRLESLFSPVLWKSYNQIPLAFKFGFLRDSQSLCQIASLGSLMWSSEPSQQWENFFGIIVLQFVGHLPIWYGIRFYPDFAPPTILLKLLLCLQTCGIYFWWVLASSCQHLVAILVLLHVLLLCHPEPWTNFKILHIYTYDKK